MTSGSESSNSDLALPGLGLELSCYDTKPAGTTIDTGYPNHVASSAYKPRDNNDLLELRVLDEPQHWSQLRRTELEIAMIRITNAITDKPNWKGKIWDRTVCKAWQDEIQQALSAADTRYAEKSRDFRNGPFYWGPDIDHKAAEFIIHELKYKAGIQNDFTSILGLGGADIIKTDTLIPESFRQTLKGLIENIQQAPINWHPGREGIVQDIVHPSMFPLYFGKTTFVKETFPLWKAPAFAGQGEIIPEPKPAAGYSNRFQWLPAEVRGHPDYAYFESYINNLDTVHEELYSAIAEVIRYSLPLWNECIATQTEDAPRRVPCYDEDALWVVDETTIRIPPFTKEEPDSTSENTDPRKILQSLQSRKWDASLWNRISARMEWPEPSTFPDWRAKMELHGQIVRPNLKSYLVSKGLQVIVKIARISLDPENPVFSGGALHIEGMPNEHICATSIYYYESVNISKAQVAFSGGAHMGSCRYGQDDYTCLEHIYGTSLSEAPAIQEFVAVATPQGRLMAFPNVFQHRILPFELKDKTKPGHRGMVVLWLVNPQKRIISTQHVPPQQPDVWRSMLGELEQTYGLQSAREMIQTRTEPMSITEAEAIRLELMSERRRDIDALPTYPHTYSFCEH